MNTLKLINLKRTVMGSEVIIMPVIFGAIFGVFYLYLSTRNKERLALIEKGVDASIFMRGHQKTAPFWKILILNLALLLMGVGIGVFIALLLTSFTSLNADGVYPATIFFMAGVGLFAGFHMTKDLDKE